MQDISLIEKFKPFFDSDRGVSPVIAVALLILIAIGFAVAIQGAGGDIIDGIAQPPDAHIDGNPQADSIILSVLSVQNADELELLIDGDPVENDDILKGDIDEWRDNPRAGLTAEIAVDDDDDIQLQVIAIDLPENERMVYSYHLSN